MNIEQVVCFISIFLCCAKGDNYLKKSWLPHSMNKSWFHYVRSDMINSLQFANQQTPYDIVLYVTNVILSMDTLFKKHLNTLINYRSTNTKDIHIYVPVGRVQHIPFSSYHYSCILWIKVLPLFSINLTLLSVNTHYTTFYECDNVLIYWQEQLVYQSCGRITNPKIIYINHHTATIRYVNCPKMHEIDIIYQVMEKNIIKSVYDRHNPLNFFTSLSPVYDIGTITIYHWLVRVQKIHKTQLFVKSFTHQEITIYDGPGNLSPILLQAGDVVDKQNTINNNNIQGNGSHNTTKGNVADSKMIHVKVKCSSFQCYLIRTIHKNHIKDINENTVHYNSSTEHYIDVINIHNGTKHTIITDHILTSDHMVYKLVTKNDLGIFLNISNINMTSSSIWDCTFGGVAVLEGGEHDPQSRMTLCGRERGEHSVMDNEFLYYSMGNAVYFTFYRYIFYGSLKFTLEVTATKCKGVLMSLTPSVTLECANDIVIYNSTKQAFFKETTFSIHFPPNLCIAFQLCAADYLYRKRSDHTDYEINFSQLYHKQRFATKLDVKYFSWPSNWEDGTFLLAPDGAQIRGISSFKQTMPQWMKVQPLVILAQHIDCIINPWVRSYANNMELAYLDVNQ